MVNGLGGHEDPRSLTLSLRFQRGRAWVAGRLPRPGLPPKRVGRVALVTPGSSGVAFHLESDQQGDLAGETSALPSWRGCLATLKLTFSMIVSNSRSRKLKETYGS